MAIREGGPSWVRRPERQGEEFRSALTQLREWQNMHLPLHLLHEDIHGRRRWVQIADFHLPARQPSSSTSRMDSVRVFVRDPDVPSPVFVSPEELVAWQDRYFLESMTGLKERALTHAPVPHWYRERTLQTAPAVAEFAVEEIPLAVALQDLMGHGLHGSGLPEAASSEAYVEALSFLQDQIMERRVAGLDAPSLEEPRRRALEERLAIIERWRVCALPIFIKTSNDPDAPWIQARWEYDSLGFEQDQEDLGEKNVCISYDEPDPVSGDIETFAKWIRSERLIKFQEAYAAECARRILDERLRPSEWFGRSDIGEEKPAASTGYPDDPVPSEKEKSQALSSAIETYRHYAYAREHLDVSSAGWAPPEPEFLRAWSTWALGRALPPKHPLVIAREVEQPHWRDQDYQELIKRIQPHLAAIEHDVFREQIKRFGTASVGLPGAMTVRSLTRILRGTL